MMRKFIISILFLSIFSTGFSQDMVVDTAKTTSGLRLRAIAEIGFLGVLDHKVQFSESGTYFNYKTDGGQDVLFPFSRFSMELDFKDRNTFVFLYQPLRLESQVLLDDDLVVDELTFPANTAVNLLYNFPFYRFSYLREILPNSEKFGLAVGGSIQIRNATITFESTDGSLFRTNRDLGIVPALKFRGNMRLNELCYMELEADGIYAPISYLNGSDNETTGAILDANFRTYIRVSEPFRAFFNLRYLGGGAEGTSEDDPGPGDGYVKNWLHFATVSLGLVYEWAP
ncbi:MAG: hypothetical protein GVX78_01580 [Bacteroidetes bacterium]|jgi:hypothetical protein|nr:hypothetical protein [Bacteroidota bacterium]